MTPFSLIVELKLLHILNRSSPVGTSLIIKMKIIKTVLLIFSVSLAQANDLKDENTSKRQPQVLRLESAFFACSPSRLRNNIIFILFI